jgi:hypothetical protein
MAKRTVRSNGGSLISSSNHPTGCGEDPTDDTSTQTVSSAGMLGLKAEAAAQTQVLAAFTYKGVASTLQRVWVEEGAQGLMKGTSLFLQCLLFCPWVFHIRDNMGLPTYEASGEEENHSGGKIGCETDMNSIFDSKGRTSVSSEDSMGLIPISLLRVTIDSKKKNNIHQSVD